MASRLMPSRARRIDTRRMFAFLAGSFVLASRVCARSRTSRRGGGNVRHSASNHLDQLNTFLSRRRSRAKKRHAFRLKSSMCVHVQGSKRGVARRSSDEHRPPEFDHSKGLGRAEFKGNRRGASKSIGRGQSERPVVKSKCPGGHLTGCRVSIPEPKPPVPVEGEPRRNTLGEPREAGGP